MRSRAIQDLGNEPDFAQIRTASESGAMARRPPPTPHVPPGTLLLSSLAHYLTRPAERLAPSIFAVAVLTALCLGWSYRDEGHLTPESGVGYWLGILGGTIMLLLLLYPLRKRLRLLRRLGRVPGWFRLHMLLGVLGPTLILFHSNFKLGSLNSNVALGVMLTVVASGIVGRYLYARVHMGLYGSKAEIGEIIGDAQALKQAFGDDLAGADGLLEALREFESTALAPRRGVPPSLGSLLWSGIRSRRLHSALSRQAEGIIFAQARRNRWSWRQRRARLNAVRGQMALYFAAVNKASRFAVYERLFALWHVLHFPLFLLLVITAILHVVAVHLY